MEKPSFLINKMPPSLLEHYSRDLQYALGLAPLCVGLVLFMETGFSFPGIEVPRIQSYDNRSLSFLTCPRVTLTLLL